MPSPDLTKKKWWNIPAVFPIDGWTVRLRVKTSGPPIDATFTAASATFAPTAGPPLPWQECSRWRLHDWPFI